MRTCETVKMSLLPEEFYKCNIMPVKISTGPVCVKCNKLILKLIWKNNRVGVTKKYLKKKDNEGDMPYR